jgi:hypothetical protein
MTPGSLGVGALSEHIMLTPQEIDEWVEDLKTWPSGAYVFEVDTPNEYEWTIGLCTSLYFQAPVETMIAKRLKCVDLWDEFQTLIGGKLTHVNHPTSDAPHKIGSRRLPDFRVFARTRETDKPFFLFSADTHKEATAPDYQIRLDVNQYWEEAGLNLSSATLNVPYRWWLEHRSAFKAFVLKAARELGAEQGYMGFRFIDPLSIGAYGFLAEEFALARRFQGLHIDKPFYYRTPKTDLNIGMNAITWGTLIGGRWLDKAGGKAAVMAKLQEPEIRVDELPDALWIEAGAEPALLPVEDGIPYAYTQVAMALKPARTPELNLLTIGRWDDDDSVVFDRDSTQAWLARFDDDGAWPTPEQRKVLPPKGEAHGDESRRRALPGEPAPQTGWWLSVAIDGEQGRVHRRAGERMPSGEVTSKGRVVWTFDPNQSNA